MKLHNYLFLLLILLIGCGSPAYVNDVKWQSYRFDDSEAEEDQSINDLLSPYRTEMNDKMNEVLVLSTGDMRMGRPESTLGNYAADATELMAEKYTNGNVHFAIQNASGLRIGNIGSGEITLGRIYELMPFDNFLVTVELTGDEVMQMVNFMAERGGWPSSSSLNYDIKNGTSANVRIDGKPVNPNGSYTLATNDYIVKSANYFDFLKKKEMHNTNVYVRDAFAEYLRDIHAEGKTYEPKLDGRIKNLDK